MPSLLRSLLLPFVTSVFGILSTSSSSSSFLLFSSFCLSFFKPSSSSSPWAFLFTTLLLFLSFLFSSVSSTSSSSSGTSISSLPNPAYSDSSGSSSEVAVRLASSICLSFALFDFVTEVDEVSSIDSPLPRFKKWLWIYVRFLIIWIREEYDYILHI